MFVFLHPSREAAWHNTVERTATFDESISQPNPRDRHLLFEGINALLLETIGRLFRHVLQHLFPSWWRLNFVGTRERANLVLSDRMNYLFDNVPNPGESRRNWIKQTSVELFWKEIQQQSCRILHKWHEPSRMDVGQPFSSPNVHANGDAFQTISVASSTEIKSHCQ
jgi:hypothetical protein